MTRDTPFPTPQIDPETGERYLPVAARGIELLKTTMLNKGTVFTSEEREDFGLIGMRARPGQAHRGGNVVHRIPAVSAGLT